MRESQGITVFTSWELLRYIWVDSRHSVEKVRSPVAANEKVEARESMKWDSVSC
jgi:hypothetical protein